MAHSGVSPSTRGLGSHTNSITEFIKVNQNVVEFELHTLTEDRHRRDLVEWPARCHIEEITNLLKPVLEARIRRAGRRWTVDEAKKKATIPKVIEGETIRMAYSFKSTHVRLHCLFQSRGHFRGFRMFGEKVLVYACPLRKDSQANTSLTTAHGAQISLGDGLGSQKEKTSSYFRETEPQVPKPKLPRPLGRRRPLRINTKRSTPSETEETGVTVTTQVTITVNHILRLDPQFEKSQSSEKTQGGPANNESNTNCNIKSEQPSESSPPGEVEFMGEDNQDFVDALDDPYWDDSGPDAMLTEFIDTTIDLPPIRFTTTDSSTTQNSAAAPRRHRFSFLDETLKQLQNSPRGKSSKTKRFFKSSTASSAAGSADSGFKLGKPRTKGEVTNVNVGGLYDFSDSDPEPDEAPRPVVRRARGRWRKLMQLMETDDEAGFDPSPPSPTTTSPPPPTPPPGDLTDTPESQTHEHVLKYSLGTPDEPRALGTKQVSKPSRSVPGDVSKPISEEAFKACPARVVRISKRSPNVDLYNKGASLQRLSGSSSVAGVCNIDFSRFVEDTAEDTATSMEDQVKSVRSVGDLTLAHLAYLVTKHEQDLRDIFQGKNPTRRHLDYKAGGKRRNNLKYQIPMGCFSDEQHDTIMELLLSMFCRKHNNYLDYVLKVMLPEVLILVYMDVNRTDATDAEDAMSHAAPSINFAL